MNLIILCGSSMLQNNKTH